MIQAPISLTPQPEVPAAPSVAPVTEDNELRVGVVGGSNTLMKNGYVQALSLNLQQICGLRVSLEVIAVGATSTLVGLANLCRSGIHQRVDVLIFEYALNDAASFGGSPGLYEHWAKSYEAVIRKSRAENPELLFVSLVLGQKSGAHVSRICPISAGIHYLGLRYGVQTVDINQTLAAHQPEIYNSHRLYADVSHYSRPEGVELIGRILAQRVSCALSAARPRKLPAPLYAGNYAHAKYLALPNDSRIDSALVGTCQNRVFNESYIELLGDQELSFEISGRVLLLYFVSRPASPVIEIRVGDAKHRQATCRATFRKKALKFLLSGLSPEFHGNYSIAGQRSRCIIGLASGNEHAEVVETDTNEAAGVFVAPVQGGEPPTLWLVGILYCGNITRLAIE